MASWTGTDRAILERGNIAEVRERIEDIFGNRGVDAGGLASETAEERIARIAQEVMSGQRSFDSVRVSVDRIAEKTGGTPGGVDEDGNPVGDPEEGNVNDPAENIAEPEPRDFFGEAQAMFPYIPKDLLNIYANKWDETGSPQQALNAMRQDPLYEQYFPGNRNNDGLLAMSEADYMAYTEAARTMMSQAGLPNDFYDSPQDIGQFVAGNLSLNELQARIEDGVLAARSAPDEVRNELKNFYGITDGDLAAFFLDPERGQQAIMRQFTAAQVGAASQMTGYGNLTADEAERLVSSGVDASRAREGFSELTRMDEIFGRLVGHRRDGISRDDQLAGVFEGDAEARDNMRRAQERRVATFQGGGGAAASGKQIHGLGTGTS